MLYEGSIPLYPQDLGAFTLLIPVMVATPSDTVQFLIFSSIPGGTIELLVGVNESSSYVS